MSWLYKKEEKQYKTVYRVLGFKFTIKHKEERKILVNIEDLVRRTVDVKSLPKAQGLLRDIQLSALRLLLEVDKVCKEHNIKYWIDFGTLLGAVRHKDYIPWDDDIDLGMMRDDYDKFEKVFNEAVSDKDLFVEKCCKNRGTSSILKVNHKKLPTIFLDIFPYDYYTEKLDDEGKVALNHKIKKIKKTLYYKVPNSESEKTKYWKNLLKVRDDKIYEGKTPDVSKKPAVFLGVDYDYTSSKCVFDFETMFPLSEIEFCGHKFPAPANIDLYLMTVYHDYMALPKSLHYHFDLSRVSVSEMVALKKYAETLKAD